MTRTVTITVWSKSQKTLNQPFLLRERKPYSSFLPIGRSVVFPSILDRESTDLPTPFSSSNWVRRWSICSTFAEARSLYPLLSSWPSRCSSDFKICMTVAWYIRIWSRETQPLGSWRAHPRYILSISAYRINTWIQPLTSTNNQRESHHSWGLCGMPQSMHIRICDSHGAMTSSPSLTSSCTCAAMMDYHGVHLSTVVATFRTGSSTLMRWHSAERPFLSSLVSCSCTPKNSDSISGQIINLW